MFICGTLAVSQVHSGEILGKIMDGAKAVHNKIHCGFHKLRELVKHHDHDVDPCTGISPTTTTQPPPPINPPKTESPPAPEEIAKIIGEYMTFKISYWCSLCSRIFLYERR